jgi:hypothetical protein
MGFVFRIQSETKRSTLQVCLGLVELRQLRDIVQTTIRRSNEFQNDISRQPTPSRDLNSTESPSWPATRTGVRQTKLDCRYWRSILTSHPWVWTEATVKTATPAPRITTDLTNSLPLRLDLQIHSDEDKGSRDHHCETRTVHASALLPNPLLSSPFSNRTTGKFKAFESFGDNTHDPTQRMLVTRWIYLVRIYRLVNIFDEAGQVLREIRTTSP